MLRALQFLLGRGTGESVDKRKDSAEEYTTGAKNLDNVWQIFCPEVVRI